MDPITQGVLGAAAAQLKSKPRMLAKAAVIGALAGMAPDLDVLIRSSSDPLLVLEFHRQFTHSLLFIPFGALACALVFRYVFFRHWQLPFTQVYWWSLLGYATHGLLDGCTSYGTLLLWPITNHRFAWDLISVVDPLFSIPLLALIILAATRKSHRYLCFAIAWGALYFSAAFVQHERAIAVGEEIASARGHTPINLTAKPSFANLAVWKLVYEADNRFYVNAVKPGLITTKVWEGDSVAKLDTKKNFPWLNPSSQQALDIQRFDRFSSGHLGVSPKDPMSIVDIRYSMLPHQVAPLWGIRLSRNASDTAHVAHFTNRDKRGDRFQQLMTMIFE